MTPSPFMPYRESPGYHKSRRLRSLHFLVVAMSIFCVESVMSASEVIDLSVNTSQIDSNLKNLNVIGKKIIPDVSTILQSNDDKFDSLRQFLIAGWPALESNGYQISKEIPFSIIVPKFDIRTIEKASLKDVMLEHLIPGKAFDTFNGDESYANSNGHAITFKNMKQLNESQWTLNDLKILRTFQVNENIAVIFIDGFLGDRKTAFAKRNIQETNRYNEPQRLEMKNATKTEATQSNDSKLKPLVAFLASMKSGTKVFQHFLSKSNLTLAMDDRPYTVLIPSDNAFQRWHPIDWGFYPFSVQDFTESVLRNHFIQYETPLRMVDIKNTKQIKMQTLGGETVVFRNSPSFSVNNVSILSDYTLPNDNQVFIISEVLFVSEAVVSKLHQMHKDKETPPLLAFPWFGAQFLSHAFLALERDSRFSQITRYLNNAEIAPIISGSNYTFFVPVDDAFEKLGLDLISDDVLGSEKGVEMLLNHFVRGRLYDRDLKDGAVFQTFGGSPIKVRRNLTKNDIMVNQAKIIETEIFVYNLGTMFYIDDILYSEILREYGVDPVVTVSDTNIQGGTGPGKAIESSGNGITVNGKYPTTVTPNDVEMFESDFTEDSSILDDSPSKDSEDEIVTPKALPVYHHY